VQGALDRDDGAIAGVRVDHVDEVSQVPVEARPIVDDLDVRSSTFDVLCLP
jgi:hypothetical protein